MKQTKKHGIKKEIGLILLVFILLPLSGCGTPSRQQMSIPGGTYAGCLADGITHYKAHLGTSLQHRLGFLIMTNIATTGEEASSTWSGYFETEDGREIDYQRTADGLIINGTDQNFENGRVFLISKSEGRLFIEQLEIPIGNSTFKAYMAAIERHPGVQEFFSPQ